MSMSRRTAVLKSELLYLHVSELVKCSVNQEFILSTRSVVTSNSIRDPTTVWDVTHV